MILTLNIDLSEHEVLDKAVRYFFESIELDRSDLYSAKQVLFDLDIAINLIHKLDSVLSQYLQEDENV